MNDSEHLDGFDPNRRAYHRYWLNLKIVVAVMAVLLVTTSISGLPHIQTSYLLYGERREGQIPAAADKSEAIYLGPLGRRRIVDGQFGQRGCPYIVLVPLFECLNDSEAISYLSSGEANP